MPLSASIVALIRDEIGTDEDFADDTVDFVSGTHLDSLENIYTDTNRGNYSALRTALICWRRRRHSLQARSFDVATEGSLLSRSQRLKQMDVQIKRLEALIDTTYTSRNALVQTPYQVEEAAAGGSAEFSA